MCFGFLGFAVSCVSLGVLKLLWTSQLLARVLAALFITGITLVALEALRGLLNEEGMFGQSFVHIFHRRFEVIIVCSSMSRFEKGGGVVMLVSVQAQGQERCSGPRRPLSSLLRHVT